MHKSVKKTLFTAIIMMIMAVVMGTRTLVASATFSTPAIAITNINDGEGPSFHFSCRTNPLLNPIIISGQGAGKAESAKIQAYKVAVDWGDGTVIKGLGEFTPNSGNGPFSFTFVPEAHIYEYAGTYTIKVALYHREPSDHDDEHGHDQHDSDHEHENKNGHDHEYDNDHDDHDNTANDAEKTYNVRICPTIREENITPSPAPTPSGEVSPSPSSSEEPEPSDSPEPSPEASPEPSPTSSPTPSSSPLPSSSPTPCPSEASCQGGPTPSPSPTPEQSGGSGSSSAPESTPTPTPTPALEVQQNQSGGSGSSSGDSGGNNDPSKGPIITNNSPGSRGNGPVELGNTFVPPGRILGANTVNLAASCDSQGKYLKEYLKIGRNNNPEEVKKLQVFLNAFLGTRITVDGVFETSTLEAVNQFQVMFWQQILLPWAPYGYPDVHHPSGYSYKTTTHWINTMLCPAYNAPFPQLP